MSYNEKENNPHWNGGITTDGRGRVLILNRTHHRATHEGYVFEHILVAENALGGPIYKKTPIHHVNGVQSTNKGDNLVICQDQAYHMFLHRRQRALKACGHVDWEKCRACKVYEDPSLMTLHTRKKYHNIYIHKECNSKRMKSYFEKKKGGDSHSTS